MIKMNLTALIITAGIPTAFTGFCIWLLQKRMTKAEARREREAEQRQELMINIFKSVNATMGLAEKTAEAVARIPDANCNGDMHSALNFVKDVKHEQRDFLTEIGIRNLYDN